uniref:Uncharacterized protein n=1 Tax=viral metagenome TaxID=1070528 RepID=A0A6C0DZX5_9ZZZZ
MILNKKLFYLLNKMSRVNYVYQKPISEITETDICFLLEFKEDGIITHADSVKIPRNLDNSVDLKQLELAINNLIEYVVFKFGDRFISHV